MSNLDRLPDLLAELRELITAGNGVVKDLRNAVRDARSACAVLPETVSRRISDEVADGLEQYDTALQKAITAGTEKAYDRFDTIAMICLGMDPESVREGRRSVPDLIRAYLRAKSLPYHLVPLSEQAETEPVPEAFRKQQP